MADAHMRKIVALVVSLGLAGCASTREESAIAFQQQLPQLVADCNLAFRDGSQFGVGIVAVSAGIDACGRLAKERSLSLADPVAVNSYQGYRAAQYARLYPTSNGRPRGNTSCWGGSTCSSMPLGSSTPNLQQPSTWPTEWRPPAP
jgi:hypothetical protein